MSRLSISSLSVLLGLFAGLTRIPSHGRCLNRLPRRERCRPKRPARLGAARAVCCSVGLRSPPSLA